MNKTSPTRYAKIYIAGDYTMIKQVCAQQCKMVSVCVSVKPIDFIYSGGVESGAEITFINYPRFPDKTTGILSDMAKDLADRIRIHLGQDSYTVMTQDETYWDTTRES